MIGLRFISDLDTFIKVIDETKEEIYNKYIKSFEYKTSFKSIELNDSLKLKKETINEIIKGEISSFLFFFWNTESVEEKRREEKRREEKRREEKRREEKKLLFPGEAPPNERCPNLNSINEEKK